MCFIAGLLAVPATAHSVGPELPLRFDADPVGKDVWVLPLIVDAELVSDVKLERRLYRDGALLEQTRLKVDLKSSLQYQRSDRKILEARVPLSETKASPAVPLGRFGGLVEEQPKGGKRSYREQKEEKSEINARCSLSWHPRCPDHG